MRWTAAAAVARNETMCGRYRRWAPRHCLVAVVVHYRW